MQFYEVVLDLIKGVEVFGFCSVVCFIVMLESFIFIDFIVCDVWEILFNGEQFDLNEVFVDLCIVFIGLQVENVLVVDVDCFYINMGEGFYCFVDLVDGEVYFYFQFEVLDLCCVFVVFEQFDLKVMFQFIVIVFFVWKVVFNFFMFELIVYDDDVIVMWGFELMLCIFLYIIVFVVGFYELIFLELMSVFGCVILFGVYGCKSLWQYFDVDYIFDKICEGFVYFELKFGVLYLFVKYDQFFVLEFNVGVMENVGVVMFIEMYVFCSKVIDVVKECCVVMILYEFVYMWFGDFVIMKWWNDFWLNELFVEWVLIIVIVEVIEWIEVWIMFNVMEKIWVYCQDQFFLIYLIVVEINDFEDVQVNFDGIIYVKGGFVLKQFVVWVGIEVFFVGVLQYFQKYFWGNIEFSDLFLEFEVISGCDLSIWLKKWFEIVGVNMLELVIVEGYDGMILCFVIMQIVLVDYLMICFYCFGIGFYILIDGFFMCLYYFEVDVDGDCIEILELQGIVWFDFVFFNDDDFVYMKICFDEKFLVMVIVYLVDIYDLFVCFLVWGVVWDQICDVEMDVFVYIDFVFGNIGCEIELIMVCIMFVQLCIVVILYVVFVQCEVVCFKVVDGLWVLVEVVEFGSDSQLQFVIVFVNVFVMFEYVGIVGCLCFGEEMFFGFEIDVDLNWQLLVGLVMIGVIDVVMIDFVFVVDNIVKGVEFVVQVCVLFFDLVFKNVVWDVLIVWDDVLNMIVCLVVFGFVYFVGVLVFGEFVLKYFDMLFLVWELCIYQIVQYFIVGLFLIVLVDVVFCDVICGWFFVYQDVLFVLCCLVLENFVDVECVLVVQVCDVED